MSVLAVQSRFCCRIIRRVKKQKNAGSILFDCCYVIIICQFYVLNNLRKRNQPLNTAFREAFVLFI